MASPAGDWRSIGGDVARAALYVADPRMLGIIRGNNRPRIREPREWIDGQGAYVMLIDQIGQLFRILVEVGVVLVDRLAQDRQVLFQHGLARMLQRAKVA